MCFELTLKAAPQFRLATMHDFYDDRQKSRVLTAAVEVVGPGGITSVGLASALEWPKSKGNGPQYFDLFAAPKALAKAKRNAMRDLSPRRKRAAFEAAVLAAKHGAGRVKTLRDVTAAAPADAKAQNTPEWVKANRELHAVIADLKLPVDGAHAWIASRSTKVYKREFASIRELTPEQMSEWVDYLRKLTPGAAATLRRECGEAGGEKV
jgi:hypothetical protein